MIFSGVMAKSSRLVHLWPGAYRRPLLRKLMSFLISSWYFSAFVFVFFTPRDPRGTERLRRAVAAAAAAARARAMVSSKSKTRLRER